MEVEGDDSSRGSVLETEKLGFASSDDPDPHHPEDHDGSHEHITDLDFHENGSNFKSRVIEFLKLSTGYDVMLDRNNIIVLDSLVPMNLAFEAMIFHNVEHCPLWDSVNAEHVGILTATDIIKAMSYQSQKIPGYLDIQEKSISIYKSIQNNNVNKLLLITSYPEENLLDIIKTIVTHNIHRIPLADPNDHTVVGILSQLDILTYLLHQSDFDYQSLFDIEVERLNLGKFGDLFTAKKSDIMAKVYSIMTEHKLTCIPVVDDANVVIDIFTNNDIFHTYRTWNDSITHFDTQLDSVLLTLNKNHKRNKLKFFRKNDKLCLILGQFVSDHVTQLVCVDEYQNPIGIISLTDILNYFLT